MEAPPAISAFPVDPRSLPWLQAVYKIEAPVDISFTVHIFSGLRTAQYPPERSPRYCRDTRS